MANWASFTDDGPVSYEYAVGTSTNALADVLEILDVMLGTNLADDELGRARGDIENGAL